MPTQWRDYMHRKKVEKHTVTGALKIRRHFYSPQLQNERELLVYLPPSYSKSDLHYPVLYMHDGQNLFDEATSHAGEWHVDETMELLSREGIEAIVVGIPNAREKRINEYNPFDHEKFGQSQGDLYLQFLIETVKPEVDANFRTLPDRANTGLAGSSMGGLISLYGFFRYPQVFSRAGVFSPAFWITARRIFDMVEAAPFVPGKLYLDVGSQEIRRGAQVRKKLSYQYWSSVHEMAEVLEAKGYVLGETLLFVEDEGGRHNEADWARRLPDALRFLLKK
jgi:predicted alpha/beta superfamily hydrolase